MRSCNALEELFNGQLSFADIDAEKFLHVRRAHADRRVNAMDRLTDDVINELIIRTRRRNPVTSVVVTHDMKTARKVGDRVVMLIPLQRLEADEPQIVFDGSPSELETTRDRRVRQFVNGEAGERLMEMRGGGEPGAFA